MSSSSSLSTSVSSSSYATSSSSRSSLSSSLPTSKTSRLTEIQEELKEIIELQKLRLQATEQEITDKQQSHSGKLNITKQSELETKKAPAKYVWNDDEENPRKRTLEFKEDKEVQSDSSEEENTSQVRITIEKEPSYVSSHSSTSQKMKSEVPSVNMQDEDSFHLIRHSLNEYDKAAGPLPPICDVMKHDVVSSSEWLSSQSELERNAVANKSQQGLEKYHSYKSSNGRADIPHYFSNDNNHLPHPPHHYNKYSIRQWQDKQRRKQSLLQQEKEENERFRQEELYKLELETQLINRNKNALPLTSMSTFQLKKTIDYLWLSRSEKMKHKLKREALLQKTGKETIPFAAHKEKQEHKHNKINENNKENKIGKMMVDNKKAFMHDEQWLDVSAIHNVAAITLNKPLKAADANTFCGNNNDKNNRTAESSSNNSVKGKAVIDTNAGELYYYYNKGFRLLQYV